MKGFRTCFTVDCRAALEGFEEGREGHFINGEGFLDVFLVGLQLGLLRKSSLLGFWKMFGDFLNF